MRNLIGQVVVGSRLLNGKDVTIETVFVTEQTEHGVKGIPYTDSSAYSIQYGKTLPIVGTEAFTLKVKPLNKVQRLATLRRMRNAVETELKSQNRQWVPNIYENARLALDEAVRVLTETPTVVDILVIF